MSETKYTPGPWKCFYKAKYDEWHVGLPTENSAFMMVALCPDGVPGYEPGEAEANARLIAAAPELFEIVQFVSTWEMIPPISVGEFDKFLMRVKAVIAKVEEIRRPR